MKVPSLKRVFDIVAASTGIVLATPVMLATAAVMAVANQSFPLFIQKRLGHNGKSFDIYKIKTMKDSFNRAGQPLPEEERTTDIAKIIRKARLDELPQLFNILKGDMTFVGPRPMRPIQRIYHDPLRMSVKPGLTGLAQLMGSITLPREEVIRYDHLYINKTRQKTALGHFIYDLCIIAKTVPSLIKNRKSPYFRKIPETAV